MEKGRLRGGPFLPLSSPGYWGMQAGAGSRFSNARLPVLPTATARTVEQRLAPVANLATNEPVPEARTVWALRAPETVTVTRTRSCERKCEPASSSDALFASRRSGRGDEIKPRPVRARTSAAAATAASAIPVVRMPAQYAKARSPFAPPGPSAPEHRAARARRLTLPFPRARPRHRDRLGCAERTNGARLGQRVVRRRLPDRGRALLRRPCGRDGQHRKPGVAEAAPGTGLHAPVAG